MKKTIKIISIAIIASIISIIAIIIILISIGMYEKYFVFEEVPIQKIENSKYGYLNYFGNKKTYLSKEEIKNVENFISKNKEKWQKRANFIDFPVDESISVIYLYENKNKEKEEINIISWQNKNNKNLYKTLIIQEEDRHIDIIKKFDEIEIKPIKEIISKIEGK